MNVFVNKLAAPKNLISFLIFFTAMLIASTNAFAEDVSIKGLDINSLNDEQMATIPGSDKEVNGPVNLMLNEQAVLQLPDDMKFKPVASNSEREQLESEGIPINYLGMIFPKSSDEDWFIAVSYFPSGYIKNSSSSVLDPNKLLKRLKSNIEIENEERNDENKTLLKVFGDWQVLPNYNIARHQLGFAFLMRYPNSEPIVCYTLDSLGKNGYFNFIFKTNEATFSGQKKIADNIIAKLQFIKGERYEDYIEGTDEVAPFGIAEVVAGNETDKSIPFDLTETIKKHPLLFFLFIISGIVWAVSLFMLASKHRLKIRAMPPANNNQTDDLLTSMISNKKTSEHSFAAAIRKFYSSYKAHRSDYFMIWRSMFVFCFMFNFISSVFNLPVKIKDFMIVVFMLPYFVTFVRLATYQEFDFVLYALPKVNLRVVRALLWSQAKVFLCGFPFVLAFINYSLGQQFNIITPEVGMFATTCLSLIGLYILLRFLVSTVAVCYDIPNPLQSSWNATKGNLIKLLFVLLIILGLCFLMTDVNNSTFDVRPGELIQGVVLNDSLSFLQALGSIAVFVSIQFVIFTLYAITGLKIFGIRSE